MASSDQAGFTISECQGKIFLRYRFMSPTPICPDSVGPERGTGSGYFKKVPRVSLMGRYAQQ